MGMDQSCSDHKLISLTYLLSTCEIVVNRNGNNICAAAVTRELQIWTSPCCCLNTCGQGPLSFSTSLMILESPHGYSKYKNQHFTVNLYGVIFFRQINNYSVWFYNGNSQAFPLCMNPVKHFQRRLASLLLCIQSQWST